MAKSLDNEFRLYEAQGFMARWLGWRAFKYPSNALFFSQCKAVHSVGLTHALWVLFVDSQFKAVGPWHYLAANRWVCEPKAWGVLEVAPTTSSVELMHWQQALFAKNFTHYVWRWPDRFQIRCDK